jgi:5'-methylthioadenosine phosphorylase
MFMFLAEIGIIGGSGLYEMEGLADVETVKVDTPFGDPSTSSLERLREQGWPSSEAWQGHRSPSEVNYRANIYAMKKPGWAE